MAPSRLQGSHLPDFGKGEGLNPGLSATRAGKLLPASARAGGAFRLLGLLQPLQPRLAGIFGRLNYQLLPIEQGSFGVGGAFKAGEPVQAGPVKAHFQ